MQLAGAFKPTGLQLLFINQTYHRYCRCHNMYLDQPFPLDTRKLKEKIGKQTTPPGSAFEKEMTFKVPAEIGVPASEIKVGNRLC